MLYELHMKDGNVVNFMVDMIGDDEDMIAMLAEDAGEIADSEDVVKVVAV